MSSNISQNAAQHKSVAQRKRDDFVTIRPFRMSLMTNMERRECSMRSNIISTQIIENKLPSNATLTCSISTK